MIAIHAITLWNPWASWVSRKLKSVETRPHNRFSHLKGQWIAIHAGRRWHEDAFSIAAPYLDQWKFSESAQGCDEFRRECGHILCLAHVIEARPLTAKDSIFALCDCSGGDLHGLIFDRICPLADPVPAHGKQGIWNWTPPATETHWSIVHHCQPRRDGMPCFDCSHEVTA